MAAVSIESQLTTKTNTVDVDNVSKSQTAPLSLVSEDEDDNDNDNDDDDDTIDILESASSSSPPSGLCGALPESASCSLQMKERIVDLKQKVEQKGGGLISKFRKKKHHPSTLSLSSEASSSLYDPSLYLCWTARNDINNNNNNNNNNNDGDNNRDDGIVDDYDNNGDDNDGILVRRVAVDQEDLPIPASVIGDPNRNVCVITTAAMPWRTGTAVNPLLRALYLVRYQKEERGRHRERLRKNNRGDCEGKRREESNNATASASAAANHEGESGSVTLVIPWLESPQDRNKLYGPTNEFNDAKEQEEWIRSYCRERCNMVEEEKELKMIFYPAFYLAGFGSIFPKVDLCNFIPKELVDVAVLEEPEHLNWFRMPNSKEESQRAICVDADENDSSERSGGGEKVVINEISSDDSAATVEKSTDAMMQPNNDSNNPQPKQDATNDNDQKTPPSQPPIRRKYIEKAKLGWTHRFNFVVGIVHTNYEAYARQYGIGASLIGAPAIGAMSALTIRAYCHQVVKLSDTLPNFAPGKEVTCNVHGVRSEFSEGVDLNAMASSSGVHRGQRDGKADDDEGDADAPSPVYFIGKLVWAKGFDLMLELQDIFRRRNGGEYFHIDVYGGGPDEKAIARAFHGRNHSTPTKRPTSSSKNKDSSSDATSSCPVDSKDLNAAAVFANPGSIKDQSGHAIEQMQRLRRPSSGTDIGVEVDDVVAQYFNLGFEVNQMTGSATYVKESRRGLEGEQGEGNNSKNPLDIIGDLSGKSIDTGVKTSQAVYNIADSSIKHILNMSFSQLKQPLKHRKGKGESVAKKSDDNKGMEDDGKKVGKQPHFVFDPPASRFEWRRHPIPAKFPGVIDHAQLKNVPHKIFLNPSTSEVLCTTTAEALAMNKFAIIPKHPSNTFFLQFTNCLAYETLEECADKMEWALKNTPTLLSEEERRKFTWEAATERLLESSIVTVKQARKRAEDGMDKTDARIAYWLSESGEKSNMIRSLFHKNGDGVGDVYGDHSPLDDG